MSEFYIEGLPQLFKKLQQITGDRGDLLDSAIMVSLGRAGALIEGDAKKLCPVDSGRLRNSINHRVEKIGSDYFCTVGTNVDYAVYVEFGTGPVGAASAIDSPPGIQLKYRSTPWLFLLTDGEGNPILSPKGKKQFFMTRGQKAQPFLYPAFKNNKANVMRVIEDSIRFQIAKLGG